MEISFMCDIVTPFPTASSRAVTFAALTCYNPAMIYVGKEFTSSVAGRRLVNVKCEKCSTRFCYELTRVATGSASAPYFLGQESASNRAEESAEKNLVKRLQREVELVPCPKCYWVNEDAVALYRRRRYRGAWAIIIGLIIAAPLAAVAITSNFFYGDERSEAVSRYVTLSAIVGGPVLVLAVRRQLRRRINPNETYPRRPTLPPGTPAALVEAVDPKTGHRMLVPAEINSPQPAGSEWAVVRAGELDLLPLCCVCLADATTTYSPPLQVNIGSDVAVPLCRNCLTGQRRRWWLTAFAMVVVAAAIGAIVSLVSNADEISRWFIFGTLTLVFALIGGVIVAGQVSRPYRLRKVDSDRGIFKFAAKNPQYTARLCEFIEQRERSAAPSPVVSVAE
jgi:hypothetical protein